MNTTMPKKEPEPHSTKKKRRIKNNDTHRTSLYYYAYILQYVATRLCSSAAPSIHVVINQYQWQNNVHQHHGHKIVDENFYGEQLLRTSMQSKKYSTIATIIQRSAAAQTTTPALTSARVTVGFWGSYIGRCMLAHKAL